MFSLLFFSCTAPCPEGSLRGDDGLCYLVDEEPDPTVPEFGPLEPELSPDEAVEKMEQALSWGLVDGITIFDVYVSFLSNRDADCPPGESEDIEGYGGVWATVIGESCTADTGYTFLGLSLFYEELVFAGEKLGKTGTLATEDRWGYSMVASYELTDPEGFSFIGGGSSIHSWAQQEDGAIAWNSFIGGTFSYSPAGGWMGDGIDASLFMDGSLVDGRRIANMQGGVGYSGADISFEALTYDSDVGYPVGTFRLRDATNYWFSIELGEGGCGPMTWRHLNLGEQCVDIVPAIEQLLDTVEADHR